LCLAVALAFADTGARAQAQDADFVIRDIRVEGAQRTEAGTVFGYLPLRVGDRYDAAKGVAAIRALYATGLFKDVRSRPMVMCCWWWSRSGQRSPRSNWSA